MTSFVRDTAASRHPMGRISAAVMIATLSAPVAADIQYNWQIAANGIWSDNVFLEGVGPDTQSTFALEVNPTFHLEQESSRLRSNLDYDFSYITYTESLADQQAFHNLDASTELSVIPGWFYLPAAVRYSQALIDPTGPGSYGGGLFGSGNLSDVAGYRVAPRIQHQTSWGEINAEYTIGQVDYSESALDSSDDTGASILIGVGDPEASLAGRVSYITQKSEYETAETYRFDTALAEVGYRVVRDLRLIAQAGLESDIETDVTKGGLDQSFWRAGAEWQASLDNRFEILVGRRFFGTTYDVTWVRTSRNLETEFRYAEDPTTQSRQFSLDPFAFGTDQSQNSGVRGSQGYGRLSPDAYLSKRLEGTGTLVGRLTRVGLRLSAETREYFVDGREDDLREIGIFAERRFGPSVNVRVGLDSAADTLREGAEYEENRISFSVSRQFTQSLSGEIEASYVERTGDLDEYDVTWLRVGVVKRFGED